jgi:hypothetical protein
MLLWFADGFEAAGKFQNWPGREGQSEPGLMRRGYSGSPIAIHRNHCGRVAFSSGKATLHELDQCTLIGEPL